MRTADKRRNKSQAEGAVPKGTSSHLQRQAYLYVRQSTLRQVFENTESTKRQYALRENARLLSVGL